MMKVCVSVCVFCGLFAVAEGVIWMVPLGGAAGFESGSVGCLIFSPPKTWRGSGECSHTFLSLSLSSEQHEHWHCHVLVGHQPSDSCVWNPWDRSPLLLLRHHFTVAGSLTCLFLSYSYSYSYSFFFFLWWFLDFSKLSSNFIALLTLRSRTSSPGWWSWVHPVWTSTHNTMQ